MMALPIIVLSAIIFGKYVIVTSNYYLILPALLFSIVLALIFSTISVDKKSHSHSSTAGVSVVPTTANVGKTEKIDDVDSAIPDPIQSGYDIPLM